MAQTGSYYAQIIADSGQYAHLLQRVLARPGDTFHGEAVVNLSQANAGVIINFYLVADDNNGNTIGSSIWSATYNVAGGAPMIVNTGPLPAGTSKIRFYLW